MRGLLGERRARRKAAAAAVAQRGAPLRQAGAACGPLPCAITDASPLRQTASARAANRRVAAMVARLFAMRGAAAQRAAMLKGGESAREQHRSKPRASRAGADASCAAARGERMRLTAACSRLPSSSRRRPPPWHATRQAALLPLQSVFDCTFTGFRGAIHGCGRLRRHLVQPRAAGSCPAALVLYLN